MREAKATTSDWTLVRLAGIGDTPKIAIIGEGCSVILRALLNISKKEDQKSASLQQEKNMSMICRRQVTSLTRVTGTWKQSAKPSFCEINPV